MSTIIRLPRKAGPRMIARRPRLAQSELTQGLLAAYVAYPGHPASNQYPLNLVDAYRDRVPHPGGSVTTGYNGKHWYWNTTSAFSSLNDSITEGPWNNHAILLVGTYLGSDGTSINFTDLGGTGANWVLGIGGGAADVWKNTHTGGGELLNGPTGDLLRYYDGARPFAVMFGVGPTYDQYVYDQYGGLTTKTHVSNGTNTADDWGIGVHADMQIAAAFFWEREVSHGDAHRLVHDWRNFTELLHWSPRTISLPSAAAATSAATVIRTTSKTGRDVPQLGRRYEVDYTNPLSQHLAMCIMPFADGDGNMGIYDAVSGTHLASPIWATAPTITTARFPYWLGGLNIPAFEVSATTNAVLDTAVSFTGGTGGVDLLGVVPTTTWRNYARLALNGSAVDPIYLSNTRDPRYWRYSVDFGGTGINKEGTAQSTRQGIMDYVAGMSYTSTDHRLFVNGAQDATDTTDVGTSSVDKSYLDFNSASAYQTKCSFYTKPLSPEAIADIARRPFQQLKVAPVRTIVLPGAAAASSATTVIRVPR